MSPPSPCKASKYLALTTSKSYVHGIATSTTVSPVNAGTWTLANVHSRLFSVWPQSEDSPKTSSRRSCSVGEYGRCAAAMRTCTPSAMLRIGSGSRWRMRSLNAIVGTTANGSAAAPSTVKSRSGTLGPSGWRQNRRAGGDRIARFGADAGGPPRGHPEPTAFILDARIGRRRRVALADAGDVRWRVGRGVGFTYP